MQKYTVWGLTETKHEKSVTLRAETPQQAAEKAKKKGLMPPYSVYNEFYRCLCRIEKEEPPEIKLVTKEDIQREKMEEREGCGCCLGVIIIAIMIVLFAPDSPPAEERFNQAARQAITLDKLQVLFTKITLGITREQLEHYTIQKGLYYDTEKFNGRWREIESYKISFDYESAQHFYAKSNDYIEVEFDIHNNYKFIKAKYYNAKHFAWAEYIPPRSYSFAYYDSTELELEKREKKKSCATALQAIELIMAKKK